MEKKELKEFIHYLTQGKNISREQRLKVGELLARDYIQKGINATLKNGSVEEQHGFKALSALDTAYFLSQFNNPMGLKYLTHDFDSITDGRPQSIESIYNQVKEVLRKKDYKIPQSLWILINNFLEGKKKWSDTFGVAHDSYLINPMWIDWSNRNNMHPINNSIFAKEIMAFRSTIRLVSPSLKDICEKAKNGLSLNIEEDKLEKADFYTNTYILYVVIKRILLMMSRRGDKYPNVFISFKRNTDAEGRMLRKIIITQKESYANKSLNDIIDRLAKNNEAGDFGSIRSILNGYCLWQIESIWDGQPLRWNILKTDNMSEIETIEGDSIRGFTHILTYYLV